MFTKTNLTTVILSGSKSGLERLPEYLKIGIRAGRIPVFNLENKVGQAV